jgi:Tol biopolymer transport system component
MQRAEGGWLGHVRSSGSQTVRPLLTLLVVVGAMLVSAAPAHAAFPGANGKIAYAKSSASGGPYYGIYTVNPDGTGQVQLTSSPDSTYYDERPDWSSDGTKIAFDRNLDQMGTEIPCSSVPGVCGIWTMNADGTNPQRLSDCCHDPSWSPDGTKIVAFGSPGMLSSPRIQVINTNGTGVTQLPASGDEPRWSPDGTKIAYRGDGPPNPFGETRHEIFVMNPDGSGQTNLTNSPDQDYEPAWSPDGTKLVFERSDVNGTFEIYSMNADGTGKTRLTNNAFNDYDPDWSADGTQIVFSRPEPGGGAQLYAMNADGTNQHRVLAIDGSNSIGASWQPLPAATYHHPQSASQLNVSLVPAFKPCGTGGNPSNAKHAPPLATSSCNPPKPSVLAAVGVSSQSSAQMSVTPGDTDPTNGNQANVSISASLTDIQATSGGDYNPNASGPDLTAVTRLRLTDKANGYGGLPATATEYDLRVPIACSPTADPTLGSTCSASTTANALYSRFIVEQRQTIVQAFRTRVDDAGANGVPGDSDDRIFATQGVFVP